MKKVKNCNSLIILGITLLLIIIFGIITIKENFATKTTSNDMENNFNPNIIVKDVKLPEDMNIAIMQQNNTDYPNNDISLSNDILYADCFKNCLNVDSCQGIVTDFIPNSGLSGRCWMKNKMNNDNRKTINTNTSSNKRYSTIIPK